VGQNFCRAALELALGYAQQQGASHIHRLTLRVGQLSGVIPEALRFAFEIVVQGTIQIVRTGLAISSTLTRIIWKMTTKLRNITEVYPSEARVGKLKLFNL
jgi:hypothetical protein